MYVAWESLWQGERETTETIGLAQTILGVEEMDVSFDDEPKPWDGTVSSVADEVFGTSVTITRANLKEELVRLFG